MFRFLVLFFVAAVVTGCASRNDPTMDGSQIAPNVLAGSVDLSIDDIPSELIDNVRPRSIRRFTDDNMRSDDSEWAGDRDPLTLAWSTGLRSLNLYGGIKSRYVIDAEYYDRQDALFSADWQTKQNFRLIDTTNDEVIYREQGTFKAEDDISESGNFLISFLVGDYHVQRKRVQRRNAGYKKAIETGILNITKNFGNPLARAKAQSFAPRASQISNDSSGTAPQKAKMIDFGTFANRADAVQQWEFVRTNYASSVAGYEGELIAGNNSNGPIFNLVAHPRHESRDARTQCLEIRSFGGSCTTR